MQLPDLIIIRYLNLSEINKDEVHFANTLTLTKE